MSIDLGRIHPLTGPVHVEGAEPGDILEVEVLDVAPLVDFGYVVLSPTVHLPLTLEARHGVPGQHRMTGRVAVITGSSRGIGAGLVTGYRGPGSSG